MNTINETKQLTKEEIINRNNVYININMAGCKDRVLTYLLFTLEHLENINNTKVSHQFLAKQVNASVETVKRKLKKLKELNLINWESGKDKKEANTYSINHEVYNDLKFKLNSFKTMIDRLDFINNFFKQKPTTSLMFKKSKELDNGIDEDDEILNKEGCVDTRNLLQVNLMKEMLQQQAPIATPVIEEEEVKEPLNKEEVKEELSDEEIRQIFKENGDEW